MIQARTLFCALVFVVACGHSSHVRILATRPKEVVALRVVDPTILEEIRYATDHNFVGHPIRGYVKGVCLLTEKAARALSRAQLEARQFGLSFKVYDCYRPQKAVDEFVEWSKVSSDQKMKAEFYPKVDKEKLFDEGYIWIRSSHSRGSAIDVTLVAEEKVLDMGTPYDFFDPLAHTANPNPNPLQRRNRLLLKALLEKYGFRNYEKEWWHFFFDGEPYPDTFFNFDVE